MNYCIQPGESVTWCVMRQQHEEFERKEVELPSVFIAGCDTREDADKILHALQLQALDLRRPEKDEMNILKGLTTEDQQLLIDIARALSD